MNRLKKTLKIFSVLLLILSVWIYLNSIEYEYFDDHEILSKVVSIPPAENGYTAISYLGEVDFELFDSEDNNNLQLHVHDDAWDQSFVDRILSENNKLFDDVKIANSKPYFKLPESMEVYEYHKYWHYIRIVNLHLLKAKNYIRNNQMDEAISVIRGTLTFSQKFSQEESRYQMISYLIGYAFQEWCLKMIHQHVLSKPLSADQYDALLDALEQISPYEKSGFSRVYINEYRNVKAYVFEPIRKTFAQRYASYEESIKIWEDNYREKEDPPWPRPGMYEFMQVLFPGYYFHPNKILKVIGPELMDMHRQSSEYCKNVKVGYEGETDWSNKDASWSDIIKPGSLSDRDLERQINRKSYFEKRCFSYIYSDAVKAIIALEKYKMRQGDYPDNLEALVPDYIKSMPVDYFTGGNLLYSKEKGWLYSVGANYQDNGGDLEEIYLSYCNKGSRCYNNPTVPILYEQENESPPSTPPIE